MNLKKLIYRFAFSLKNGTESLNYGRDIINKWSLEYISDLDSKEAAVLDIGAGSGIDLLNITRSVHNKTVKPFAIEVHEPNVMEARKNGITVFPLNMEKDPIPAEDGSFDVVIANQTIEHTKEIFWIFSEISRVVKPGGIVLIGVPNLASLHNRILLLLGEQPTAIEVLGPHIRGYTAPSFKKFATCDNYFELLSVKGSNFYPFPSPVSGMLSKIFPTLSVGVFFLLRRTEKKGRFIDILRSRFFETPYYQGSEKDC